ncbi:hypothetical protein ACHAWU_004561 [Discostella pseudostelligera]|uniref:Uncharacterized protein n=1 Tax=Discostella pseudostelligera TaxID=259834 RepID=A0ABD3MJA6_9STRA
MDLSATAAALANKAPATHGTTTTATTEGSNSKPASAIMPTKTTHTQSTNFAPFFGSEYITTTDSNLATLKFHPYLQTRTDNNTAEAAIPSATIHWISQTDSNTVGTTDHHDSF